MPPRWWVGVAAGVALGLGVVVAVEAGTQDASAQGGFAATAEQLRPITITAINTGPISRRSVIMTKSGIYISAPRLSRE